MDYSTIMMNNLIGKSTVKRRKEAIRLQKLDEISDSERIDLFNALKIEVDTKNYEGENINGSWVTLNMGYGNLDKSQITVLTPAMSGSNVTYGDQIKGSIYSEGKACNPPFQVIKDWQIWHDQGTSGNKFTK